VNFSASQRRVFLITWMAYAGFYFCRKNLSVVLPALQGAAGLGSFKLANIVFGYTLLYVVGQFVFGLLSDRIGARVVVGAGLLLAACSNLFMAVHSTYLWLLVFACVNGAAQSTGWSGLVKMMAAWFQGANRGVVMAWWGTNYVLGGFAATVFATWAITQETIFPQLGWRRGFVFPALLLLAVAVLFLGWVEEAPAEERVPDGDSSSWGTRASRHEQSNWANLAELLRKRPLWMVSLSYFFLELARYAFLFWLPLYMVERLHYSLRLSGYLSSFYELVGILGALIAGYASDRLARSRRAPVASVMLCGLGCSLFCQPFLSRFGPVGIAFIVSLAGIFCYGPDTLLSGALAQDIGEEKAAATATGLVEGIGHLGALFSPYVAIYISKHYGWDRLFPVLAVSAFVAAIALVPIWNFAPQRLDSVESSGEKAVHAAR
jgi:sugar phosphate permease